MQIATVPAQATSRVPRRKVPQSLDAINFPDAQLRIDVVLAVTGVSRSEWYRLVAKGEAPQPLRHGPRCSRWRAGGISKFLADRAAKGAR